MKLSNSIPENISAKQEYKKEQMQLNHQPSFKGAGLGGALNMFGNTMQGIENGGFLVSFLIQDALGMTAPRVGAAFLRDKEVTGEYNMQEGFEVLGREGLTGPCMMAVAPIMFALSAKFGKSTNINSQLIKRYGNSLKEILSKPGFDRSILNNAEKFKQEFYASNVRNILENTLGKEYVKDQSIINILKQISKYEKIPTDATLPKNWLGQPSKSKYRQQCLNEITEHINNLKYSTSSELDMLNKVKIGSKDLDEIRAFSTSDAIEAMIKYSDDAITLNKNLDKLDEAMAESIRDKSLAKRFITNVSTIAATLGVLSVLPKLYIRSSISPGARTAMQLKNNEANKDKQNSNQEVSFKAGKPKMSWLEKLGKKLSKFLDKEFVANELEYNGHNFTNTLMAGLSIFGLLTPRGLKAYNRAQVDENGKKDLSEIYEILIRDLSSSLAVVFAVPMLTRAAVTSYEDKSGFVLMQKDRSKSKWASYLDLLNPYSKAHVLKNSEINALYNNINSKDKMLNFCNYINNNGGDLEKIISKSEHVNTVFNENTMKLSELAHLSKKEKNQKILSFFESLGRDGKLDKKSVDSMITKLMKGGSKPNANKILGFARGLNSVPGIITTFLISPYILGWFIPRLTYANTRRMHEKAENERQQKAQNIDKAV